MNFFQLRNATAILDYAGKRFLIDPMLSPKGAFPGFPGTPNSERSNPLVELPLSPEDLQHQLDTLDAVIVTHTHPDHWDEAAKSLLSKSIPIFVQNSADAEEIQQCGFTDVRILDENTTFSGIRLIKTAGQHGNDTIMNVAGDLLGHVCGVVCKHPSEKTLYIAGDTIWHPHVKAAMTEHTPEIVIVNCGDAQVTDLGSIIMNAQDVLRVHECAPRATLIATHMEAVNHALLTRSALRGFASQNGFSDQLIIPEDGETVTISA